MHVSISFSDIHIITDTDHISIKEIMLLSRGRFPVCDLGFALVQVLYFQAQQVAGGSKGETCTGGVVTEQGDAEALSNTFVEMLFWRMKRRASAG